MGRSDAALFYIPSQSLLSTNHSYSCLKSVCCRKKFTYFVQEYSKYCLMVDHARNTEIDTLMEQKTWGTDDFHSTLKTHTEQVCISCTL